MIDPTIVGLVVFAIIANPVAAFELPIRIFRGSV